MSLRWGTIVLALASLGAGNALAADEDLKEIRRQIEELKSNYEARIQALEKKLQEAEAKVVAPAPPDRRPPVTALVACAAGAFLLARRPSQHTGPTLPVATPPSAAEVAEHQMGDVLGSVQDARCARAARRRAPPVLDGPPCAARWQSAGSPRRPGLRPPRSKTSPAI